MAATIKEREFLIPEKQPKMSGFTPRRIEKMTSQRLPRNLVNIECNHLLRTSREEATHGHQSLEYQLWLEAGKHNPPFPKQPDNNYSANVWRNFRTNFNSDVSTKGRTTSEAVATAYPIMIPKPSKVGSYSYGRFIQETPQLITDEKLKSIAINRTAMDRHSMDLLKLRSECRYPPIDKSGNILPPEHYKRFPHYYKPIADLPTTEYLVEQMKNSPPTPYGYHENPIKYTPSRSPAWRFNLKSGNKHYQRVMSQLQRQKSESLKETVSRVKTCTPATSTAPSEVQA